MNNQKLETYLGFARKMGALKVGMALRESLSQHKIVLLLLLPALSEKNKEKLLRREDGVRSYPIDSIDFAKLGMKEASAIGITDANLAKAIEETVVNKEERQ